MVVSHLLFFMVVAIFRELGYTFVIVVVVKGSHFIAPVGLNLQVLLSQILGSSRHA